MAIPIHLTSFDNPHIKAVLRLRRQRVRRDLRLLIAEGVRQISRASDAGLALRELYWCPSMVGRIPPLLNGIDRNQRSKESMVLCFTVTPKLMAKMAYRQNPEGILAVFEQPRVTLDDLAGPHERQRWPHELWLIAVGTQKPGNLGSMVRSAEAAGCNGVLVADGLVDAFNPNAIHASTGAVFSLPVVAGSAQAILSFVHSRRVQVIATVPGAQCVYSDVDLTGPVALVIGPEDVGLDGVWLSVAARDGCQRIGAAGAEPSIPLPDGIEGCQVSIPMLGQVVDSLNASAAAAVLLFEATRQRRGAC